MAWIDWLRKLWQPAPSRPSTGRSQDTAIDEPVVSSSGPVVLEDVHLKVGVTTTRGNVRESNEDNFYVRGENAHTVSPAKGDTVTSTGVMPQDLDIVEGLFIVADGMGGQLAGEKASELAVSIVPNQFRKRLGDGLDDRAVKRVIRESVAEANNQILAQSSLNPAFDKMGTTLVLAYFQGSKAYFAGIGDSRAYHLHAGKMERLTKDHSLATALEEAGTIRPEEAENHRFRNVLYLFLGSPEVRDGPAEHEIHMRPVSKGDRFLLATDGLTGVVRDDTIAQILASCDDSQRACEVLVNRALENNSKDNITCVVIEVA